MSRLDLSDPKRRIILARWLLAAWLLSLLLPALTFEYGDTSSGWWHLLWGWIGTMVFQFGWYANPLFAFVLVMMTTHFPAAWPLRVASVLLGLCALDTLDLFLRPEHYGFAAAHAGYYLWLAVCLIGALLGFLFARSLRPVAAASVTSKAISP